MTAPLDIDAVLFDLDGTLADTAGDLAGALNRVRADHGREPMPVDALRAYASAGARGLLGAGMGLKPDDEGYAGCCEALADWDGRADLARISARTLVIVGAQDPATTPTDLLLIADGVANSVLHVLDPGAHLTTIE